MSVWYFPVQAVKGKKIVDSFNFRCPYNNCSQYRPYARGKHGGNDIGAPKGSIVRSILAGVVVEVDRVVNSSLGRQVVVRVKSGDGTTYYTRYCHLDSIPAGIKVGVKVTKGQIIGKVGRSGLPSTAGPHLHFELSLSPDWSNVKALRDPNTGLNEASAA